MNKKFYKYSIVYVVGSLLLFNIFIVSYDIGTGTYEHVILPNGHCSFIRMEYDSVEIAFAANTLNKVIQALLLVVYLVYYYKVNKTLKMVRDMANIDRQQNRMFLKIATIMVATVGISKLGLMFSRMFGIIPGLDLVAIVALIIQQFVIMMFYLCSKKISQLCNERFYTTGTSS